MPVHTSRPLYFTVPRIVFELTSGVYRKVHTQPDPHESVWSQSASDIEFLSARDFTF